MANSSDVQYVAYLKAKFNLADADLLQVISLSQRGGYTPPLHSDSPHSSDETPSPGPVAEEEKAEVKGMDESYEEIEYDDDDEIVEYMDESLEEQIVTDTPDPSPTGAPVPAPMPLSNNDQIVEQSNALVTVDTVDEEDDMRASTLKMPETIAPEPKVREPEDVDQELSNIDEIEDAPDDEKNALAIVPAKSQAIVPARRDEENAIVTVTPPIQDRQVDDEKQEENPILYVVACFVLLLLLVLAVVLILIFVTETIPKWWEEDDDPPTMADHQPGNCNFQGQAQPNVISQCVCNDRVSIVDPAVQEQYDELVANFIRTIYPNWGFPVSSCDPANQALLWLASGPITTNALDRLQRYTMAFLYFSTEGEQWTRDTNWLSEADVCSWFGLACTNRDLGRIQLVDNSLKNLIPTELALLAQLNTLSLDDNELEDMIPTELFRMTTLKTLTLDSNELGGSVPTGIGQAAGLEVLRLGGNQFRGSLPTQVNRLTMLKVLSFENNTLLTGRIPTEFGTFRNLESLSLSSTDMRATIPSEYGRLTRLEELNVANTLVGGVLPDEFARMTNLKIIDFTGSRFRQTLPTFLGGLTDLTTLMVGNNEIAGEIPTELGNLRRLQFLGLEDNDLEGLLPTELGRLSMLENFTVYGNPYLTGNVPMEICELRDRDLTNFTSACPTREFGVLCPIATCCTNCVPLEDMNGNRRS